MARRKVTRRPGGRSKPRFRAYAPDVEAINRTIWNLYHPLMDEPEGMVRVECAVRGGRLDVNSADVDGAKLVRGTHDESDVAVYELPDRWVIVSTRHGYPTRIDIGKGPLRFAPFKRRDGAPAPARSVRRG